MEGYQQIGTGYQQIGGQPMVPRQKKFPHLKGVERDIALLDQARNPRQAAQQGYGGLADLYAMNRGVDPITNMAVAPSQFDVMQKRAELAKSGEFEALNLFNNYRNRLPGSGEALMEFRNMRQAQQQFGQQPQTTQAQASAPPNPYTASSQKTQQMYVPTGQPQPPANVPQLDTGSINGPMTMDGGVRRISSPYGTGSSIPVARGSTGQPASGGFDMQATVARNRAALDAKYPTPEIPAAGLGNPSLQPQPALAVDYMQGQKPEDRLATIDRIMNPPVKPPQPVIAASPTRIPPSVAPVVTPVQQAQVAQEPTIMQNIGRHFGQSPLGTEFSRAGSEAWQGTKDLTQGAISGVKSLGSSLKNTAMQNPNFRDSIMGRWLANRNPYLATQ